MPLKGRGGPGRGQGRKRDPLKDLRTGARTAQKILKEIDDEKEIPVLYRQLSPPQKLQTIFRLRDSAYGKPAISEEPAAGGSGTIHALITVKFVKPETNN